MQSPYRTAGSRGEAFPEADPFPSIVCMDCGQPTTSMCGEDLCARCDLKWLSRGIDWSSKLPRLMRRMREQNEQLATIQAKIDHLLGLDIIRTNGASSIRPK